jgi:two-component system, LytTR family, response regulator
MNQNTFLPSTGDGIYDAHIIISDNRTKHILPISDIMRLESKRVYTIIYAKSNRQYVCSRNLKVVYEELHSQIFFRIHKSHVINLQEVKAYREGRGGQVIMSDDTVIDVSQRKKMEFLRSFQQLSKLII